MDRDSISGERYESLKQNVTIPDYLWTEKLVYFIVQEPNISE
jgi:hypothetical protein